jgi:hypothetical protein
MKLYIAIFKKIFFSKMKNMRVKHALSGVVTSGMGESIRKGVGG